MDKNYKTCFILQNTFKTPVYVTSQRRNAMGVGLVFEADLATTEQRYKQEEDKRTDKNNWTKVHKRGKHTHR